MVLLSWNHTQNQAGARVRTIQLPWQDKNQKLVARPIFDMCQNQIS